MVSSCTISSEIACGWMPSHRARSETVQGAGGQGGHDVRVADGEGEVGGKCIVESDKWKP